LILTFENSHILTVKVSTFRLKTPTGGRQEGRDGREGREEKREGRKEGKRKGRKKGRKETDGRKEGREGRKETGKEGRKDGWKEEREWTEGRKEGRKACTLPLSAVVLMRSSIFLSICAFRFACRW
jgi:hypothetical protein